MHVADLGNVKLHYSDEGSGQPVVFINSLMTDYRMWDKLVARLPAGYRVIRYDKRAHGLSSAPPAPYKMDELVDDLARLLDALEVRDAVIVGLSIGGLIAQGLAVARPDLVRAVCLSNTAAKITTPEVWEARFKAVREGGLEAIVDATIERWFPLEFRANPEVSAWRTMFLRQLPDAFLGCGKAISETDFTASTAQLRIPVLGIGATQDGSTPAEMLRETVSSVSGGKFHLIEGAGHIPCIDAPDEYARVLSEFLTEVTGP
jgi:3-oxoadipate enol-lactonase